MRTIFSIFICLALAIPGWAQSQAANGAIEGTVSDTSGGVLPGVTVTITSVDTGAQRIVITNEKGLYRAPLLPLGTYRVLAELPGFKKFEQTDIHLSVGQTAVVNATLSIGAVSETITVSSADSPALDLARIDIGQTMGMVYNAVTPSGTNTFKGEGSYLFRRKPFSAFPFFFGCTGVAASCGPPAADAQKPETRVDTGTADVGGPIVRNKVFFYGGWEQTRRDLSSNSLINQSVRDIAPTLGLKAQPVAVPNVQTAKFAIGKADYQVNGSNRFTGRWIRFNNDAPYNSGGGTATLERATDFLDAMDSIAGQLVTTFGATRLNELRGQFAHRHQQSIANADSGTGPAISIASPAVAFGGPWSATGQGNAGFDFKQNITQVIDNFTYLRAAHAYKFGFDWQHIYDERTAAPQFVYNFPTISTYVSAKNGAAPFGYSTMSQITGNLSFNMSTNVFSAFVQDDWQIAPTVKILYGVRYDLYRYPEGIADAPLAQTHNFTVDQNNFGPRVAVAWPFDANTVVRASTAIMYDQRILRGYAHALHLSRSH